MATIRFGTAINIRLFQSLSAAVTNDSELTRLIDSRALEDEFGRFRVWSGNLGALQKGHSSLDYRLRDSPLLSSNALKLLKELEENLSEAIAIVTGARLPYEQQAKPEDIEEEDEDDFFSEDEDDESDGEVPKTELEQRFREVIDIIDNLYKLSVRIRTPTIRSRSLKASSYRPKDPESGVDILDQYAIFDLQYTRELLRYFRTPYENELRDDDVLVDRLSKGITLRRRQFKYWRRHRDKLGVSTVLEEEPQEFLPSAERPEAPRRHDTLEVQPGTPIVVALKEAGSEKTGKTILSGTEATHHHQSLDDIVDSKSVTSYATTVRDLTGRGIDLPPPPKAAEGEKDFECPYCFIICPARYGNERAWRTHVLQDLQPYLCTYTECASPDQLFRSRREWSDHESSHRKAWRCLEHPTAIYKSKAGLEGHLRLEHLDNFPENQLDSIIKVGETSTVDTRGKCPICFVDSGVEGGLNLQNHIANHLERLATFALPRDAGDDSDGASSVASRGRSASTRSQDLSYVSFDSDNTREQEKKTSTSPINPDTTLLSTSQEQLVTHGYEGTLSNQGLLSAAALGELPDSSGKRLDVFLSSQTHDDHDFDEKIFDEASAEVEEHLAEMEVFRSYLLSQPGSQSVRFLRRFGWWRGYTTFEDEAAALRALESFDSTQFPDVKVRRGVENKAALKFSLPAPEKGAPPPPTRQSTHEQDDSSSSSMPPSYDGNRDTGGQSPILSISEIPTLRSLYTSQKLLQRDQSYAPNDTFNQIISFCFYDITRLKVDAIVNSVSGTMKITRNDDSLNRHIHNAAGPGLQRECEALGKVKSGQVCLTSGYNLPSSYIIHAARPHYSRSKGMGKFDMLMECYRSSLKSAMNHGINTIAFPCIGAGGCGFPPRVAARIALQEVREFLDIQKGHTFERIIFCVLSVIDEKAYRDFLPVFFPPTHRDLENATLADPSRLRASLAARLLDVYTQVDVISRELVQFSDHVPDFPSSVLSELVSISSAFGSLKDMLFGPKESIQNLNEQTVADVDLICSVMQSIYGGVTEIVEQAKYTQKSGTQTHKTIWDDYILHMKNSQRLDMVTLLELCQNFVQSLDDILARDGIEPYEMKTMRSRLGSYRLKQTGEDDKGVREHFDEGKQVSFFLLKWWPSSHLSSDRDTIGLTPLYLNGLLTIIPPLVMYAREFHRGTTSQSRTDIIKVHQIPSITRLYQLGDLEHKPTYAVPSASFNSIVCLLRDDITRLEVDVIVNSTDNGFSGTGTLDRTVFKKGGPAMLDDCRKFGIYNEGNVKVTPGYLLPAKHVIHTIPREIYQKNSKDVMRKLYREVLYTASSLRATSIAIPTIGTGMLNYPRRDCASLALEEVKRFLETVEPTNSLERIIFCVFSSNDETIYKALLPVFFPPVDSNVNKGLPSSTSLSSSSLELGAKPLSTAEPSSTPRRTLFSSVGEAFRTVRFGKQPVTPTSRPLQPEEERALISFETHAHDCPYGACSNIAKLYAEGRNLCKDGYEQAQLVLQYLYMEPDRSVYSTILEGGKRVKVEIPPDYPLSWNLLITVEKSCRGNDRSRPFVSLKQPYTATVEHGKQHEVIPPGGTIYDAEVTVPIKRDPEKAIASISAWSDQGKTWETLHPDDCSIHIYPGKVEVYEADHQAHMQVPLLSLELTPLVLLEMFTSSELTLDKAGTFQESRIKTGGQILFGCQSSAECETLFQRLKYAKNNNPTYREHQSTQKLVEPQLSKEDETTMVDLPSVPSHDLLEPVSALTHMQELEAVQSDHNPGQDNQTFLFNSPAMNPALSVSDLATINIDDFFTYLDLALEPSSTSESDNKSDKAHSSSENSMSPPIDTSTDRQGASSIDQPTTPQAASPPVPNEQKPTDESPLDNKEEDKEESDNQIHHPRPTTPDHNQPNPIPAGARWTKIDRRLVNPQALEEANEQFEEREDCVIVFRVMSREEIMRIAERMREIRKGNEG